MVEGVLFIELDLLAARHAAHDFQGSDVGDVEDLERHLAVHLHRLRHDKRDAVAREVERACLDGLANRAVLSDNTHAYAEIDADTHELAVLMALDRLWARDAPDGDAAVNPIRAEIRRKEAITALVADGKRIDARTRARDDRDALLIERQGSHDLFFRHVLDAARVAVVIVIDEELDALSDLQYIPCFYYFACHRKVPPCLT